MVIRSSLAGRVPCAASAAVRLLPCNPLFEKLKKTAPAGVLPPDFGITLMTGPPDSASPSAPDVVTASSAALPMSGWK